MFVRVRSSIHQVEILDPIVRLVAVEVMNSLRGEQRAAQSTRHHETMFVYVSARI